MIFIKNLIKIIVFLFIANPMLFIYYILLWFKNSILSLYWIIWSFLALQIGMFIGVVYDIKNMNRINHLSIKKSIESILELCKDITGVK
jgi:hypothetical protein